MTLKKSSHRWTQVNADSLTQRHRDEEKMVRRQLQKQLVQAWEHAITQDYLTQRINSERSLQESYWACLNRLLSPKSRRMFIEPHLTISTSDHSKRYYPDIVICNTKQVIGVVELKYEPRKLPSLKKDMGSLRDISANREHLSITNKRFRGRSIDERRYDLPSNVLFVWAGVHRTPADSFSSPKTPLMSEGIDELRGCFLELHAETSSNGNPNVFSRSG